MDKIRLYATRTFTEKINDTFSFLRQSWRPLGLWLTYLLLPVSLVMAVCMNSMMGSYLQTFSRLTGSAAGGGMAGSDVVVYLASMVTNFLAGALGLSLTYACMRLYEERPEGLQGLSFGLLRPLLVRGVGRMLVLALLSVVLLLAVVLLFMAVTVVLVSGWLTSGVLLMALFYMALPVCLLPLLLTAPVYLFEDSANPLRAVARAWRLGWKTWGGLAAVVLVLGALTYMLVGLVSLPMAWSWVSRLLLLSREGFDASSSSLLGSLGQYLLSVVMCFVGQVALTVPYVGVAYHYGHACDKVDGIGIDRAIDAFDTL